MQDQTWQRLYSLLVLVGMAVLCDSKSAKIPAATGELHGTTLLTVCDISHEKRLQQYVCIQSDHALGGMWRDIDRYLRKDSLLLIV
jgi:hypothetical protein